MIDLQENIPLAPLTTLRVGGPARLFVRACSEEQVVSAIAFATEKALDVFVLGGGSNILVSDRGFDGLVIHVALTGVDAEASDPSSAIITARAGEDWDTFVEHCVRSDLAGVECLSGIPGSVGGTPVQNVGAYGQEVSETIARVRCLDRITGKIVELDNAQCGFTYRRSVFNSAARGRYVVLAVTYRLDRGGSPKIAYKDLRDHLEGRAPTLAETRQAVLAIRRAKSMVIEPDDPNRMSAGSFFKNPIVTTATLAAVAANAATSDVPSFPAGDGMVKIPAAWLIEQSGFHKGYRSGNAGISTNHSLAIVNLGNASAAEIVGLKEKIQSGVEQKFDILLQPEPVLVGFDR